MAFRFDYRTAWLALMFAAAGNALLLCGAVHFLSYPASEIPWDILYFSMTAALFVWVATGFPVFSEKISGETRLILGSCLATLLFAGFFLRSLVSPQLSESINVLINSLLSFYRSQGSDVVQNALFESITPEMILDLVENIMLRGGALISCVLLFAASRHISYIICRLSRREKATASLINFRVNSAMIWVLSGSLLLVVLTGMMKLEIPGIILWNILVLCGILYLGQGFGILQFFLAKMTSPGLKFFLQLLFVIFLFSPGINAVLLGGVALLGAAETWVPLRAPKQDGQPPTPEAGDGGE